jgi:hypothetical protein
MTALSPLNVATTLQLTSLATSANATVMPGAADLQSVSAPSTSTIVTIPSAINLVALPTYTPEGILSIAAPTASWASDSDDPVTLRMRSDYTAQTMAGRFSGLGSALLDRFKTTDSDFSQSVSFSSTSGVGGAALGLQQAGSRIGLTVKTASGVTVEIDLVSEGGGLSVSVKSSGTLSDSERDALAQLAGGFQQAIDGLGASPPKLDLSGLTQFDTSVLASVSFKYTITGDGDANISASYSQDGASRSLSVTSGAGTVNVKVDTSNPALWGTDAQRTQSVASFLQQFEDANSRGHGDESLMSMFEDGFAQLNEVYGTPSPQTLPGAQYTPWLQQSDQAMLTGLADFNASIMDTPASTNPMRTNEGDTFAYDASQSTALDGTALTGTISQHQHSHLSASYHHVLSGGGEPVLMSSMSEQNYDYVKIDDSADSTVQIVTERGALVRATLTQSSDQRTRESKYEGGVLISDVTTPEETSSSKDLLSLLKPLIDSGAAKHDTTAWQQALAQIHGMIQLNAHD